MQQVLYPRLEINISKLRTNLKVISQLLKKYDISLAMVTKAYCADRNIVLELLKDGGVDYLADSRIENLMEFKDIKIPKLLLRIPMISEVSKVVEYADISFNSEYETVKELNFEAEKRGNIHSVVLMIDLGDLREGYFDEKDLFESVEKIAKLKNIDIVGIATNLTCYGAILPSEVNLRKLVELGTRIEREYKIDLKIISGGNSSSLFLLSEGKIPKGINNLRIGEGILLGRETAYGQRLDGTYDDAFRLICEVIENKRKESLPIGEQGVDAFGERHIYVDRGPMQRVILGIGKQDIKVESLIPTNKKIEVIGASSDHTIVDITNSQKRYLIGDKIEFILNYSGIMSASTSKYVKRFYIE